MAPLNKTSKLFKGKRCEDFLNFLIKNNIFWNFIYLLSLVEILLLEKGELIPKELFGSTLNCLKCGGGVGGRWLIKN